MKKQFEWVVVEAVSILGLNADPELNIAEAPSLEEQLNYLEEDGYQIFQVLPDLENYSAHIIARKSVSE